MTAPLTLADLSASGAHRRGHFLLSSGLHSGDYLQCALHLAHPRRAEAAGARLADRIGAAGAVPELVVGPAMGALIIGHETARALDVPFLFTERVNGAMCLRRGFAVAPGQRVVVVEDVITTGTSTREVIAILAAAGATVVAVGSLANRSGRANPFAPLPYHALLELDFPTWPADDCPLCREGVPIDKPGSRPIPAQG